jgi:peptidoglycan/xylan/chitin deacetylase (PgdA/CDA1 family)
VNDVARPLPRMLGAGVRALSGVVAPGGERGRLSILIYHRVLPGTQDVNNWDPIADEFEAQMRLLRAYFAPLPLSEAIERLQKSSLPKRAICVTFDDGYADNAEVALPILKRCRVPATFFIATGYLNGGRMWNDSVVDSICALPSPDVDLRTLDLEVFPISTIAQKRTTIIEILRLWKYLPSSERQARSDALAQMAQLPRHARLMMRDDQLRELRAAGMEIGAHTVTHPILAQLGDAEARREVTEAGRALGELLREPVRLFAYPNGCPGRDYGPVHVRMVRDAGYCAAVSTARGVATAGADVYQLPRFTPWDRSTGKFAARLIQNYRHGRPELA